MPKKFTSHEDYFHDQPEAARKLLHELKECILEMVPDTTEVMTYNVPAFTMIKGGKLEQQIMIAGFKKHVGLYPHPTTIEAFKEELKGFKTGEGTVQFPLDKPLPTELIKRMVKYRWELVQKS